MSTKDDWLEELAKVFAFIALPAFIIAIVFVDFKRPKEEVDPRIKAISQFHVSSVRVNDNYLDVDTTLLSEILQNLKKSLYIGSKGNEFTNCAPSISILYENGSEEIINFFSRPPSIEECILAYS